jgi:hypothetical protein
MKTTYLDWEDRPAILYTKDDGGLEGGFVKRFSGSKWISANDLQLYGDAYVMDEDSWRAHFQNWGLEDLPSPKDFKPKEMYTDHDDYDDKWWRNE